MATFSDVRNTERKPAEIGMFCQYCKSASAMGIKDTPNLAFYLACESVLPLDLINVSSDSLKSTKSALK